MDENAIVIHVLARGQHTAALPDATDDKHWQICRRPTVEGLGDLLKNGIFC